MIHKTTKMFLRTFALMVFGAVLGVPSLVHAEYVAGWDFTALARSKTGTVLQNGTAPITLSDISSDVGVFSVDFTVDSLPDGACTLVAWKLGGDLEIIVGKTATDDGKANIQIAYGYWQGSNAGNAYTPFTTDGTYYEWTADASSHTFHIEYSHDTLGTSVYMDDERICATTSARAGNKYVLGVRIGGAFGSSAQTTWPNASFAVSGATYKDGLEQTGVALTSNGYTLNLNGNILNTDGSISIAKNGLSVAFANGDNFYSSKTITAVVEVSNVPSSGTVIDYRQGDLTNGGRHVGLSIKNATTLAQSWISTGNGNSWTPNYNDVTYSTPQGKHTIALAYNGSSGVGTQTFVDGAAGCDNRSDLCASTINLREITVGAATGSSVGAIANGMRVYSIKLYTTKLDASGATAAASDVILSDGCSAAFSSGATYKYCGSNFTNGFTIDLAGQTVALGTYPGTSGTITVNDSVSGGSATMTLPSGFIGSFAGTGKLSVTAPASILPVSGGMDLTGKTVTIPNAAGTVIAANSITIGNSGLQISYTESQPLSVMMKVENIPSVASSMVGLAMSGLNTQSAQMDVEIVASRTTTGFQNGWLNTNGTFAVKGGSDWGAASSDTVDANTDHWFTFTFQHNSGGTKAYFDGSPVAAGSEDNGLRWENIPLTVLTLGGSSFSTTALAPTTGMVIKQVSVFKEKELVASQVASVKNALDKGWIANSDCSSLTSETHRTLSNDSQIQAKGELGVESDGKLTLQNGSTVKFPAAPVWPYAMPSFLAVSDSMSTLVGACKVLDADKYYIGDSAGTCQLLLLDNGKAIPVAVLAVSSDTDWTTLADGCTQTAYVLNVTASATLNIDTSVSGLDVIIFNVNDGCTLTLTGSAISADDIRTVGSGSVVMNTSGYDVSGLTEGGYVKVLDGAITGSVGVTAVPAASESLVYYYDIKSDGVYVRTIGKTRRSINANFGNTLSVETNVGIAGVLGNKWDNFTIPGAGEVSNNTTVKVVDDANSTTFNCPGLTVSVSGTRGSWSASYTVASDPRQTYIDDNSNYTKPTVTVSGIPFAKYRAIVYHSTNDSGKKWGYDTVNGTNYYYDDQKVLQIGTSSWGSTSKVDIKEGVNALVTGVMTDPSFSVSGNYHGGDTSARGCIAAVQIVKTDVATIASAGEYTFASLFGSAASTAGDYIIDVNESATLDIPSATTVFMVAFNVAQGKTLTLTGSTLTATGGITITGNGKVATTVAAQLAGVVKGDGTIEYTGVVPTTTGTDIVFTGAAWTGTVSIKNYNDGSSRALNVNYWCNEGSKLKFTNVKGHVPGNSNTGAWQLGYDGSTLGELILEDDGDKVAFDRADGWSHESTHNSYCMFAKLSGSGTLKDSKNQTIYLVFKDATGFSGVINVLNGTSVIIGDSSPTGTTYDRMIVVDSGKSATIANGKTWHAGYCGVYISGTLKFVGTGEASSAVGPVATANGSTLDFSEATSDTRISGALMLASGTTIKLPAGVDLSTGYQVASSGGSGFINATVQIDGGSTITENIRFDSGTIYVVSPVEIDDEAKVYTVSEVFGTPTATSDYVINVKATATMTVPGTEVRTVTYNFTADGNTITLADGYKVDASTINLNITDASSLTAGNYTLFQWTTPQQFTTTCAGYGRFASVDTTGLASGLTAEVVYGAKAIYLRVYDTETQAARKPLVIWPYGDSITEGYNAQHTGPNYRILLYQKLRMLGYNVKSTGVYGLDDGYDAVDPSGTALTDTDKWHSAKASSVVSAGLSGAVASKGALVENVDTMCVQAGTPDVVLLHIGVNDLNGSWMKDVESVFNAWCDVVDRLVRNLPTSKIVVSTALHGREPNKATTNARVDQYNAMIKAKMADMPTEWSGHVVLADLCSIVQSQDTGILYSDHVHPDWWGHDQMAEGWLDKIVELYDDPDATDFPSQAALPAIPDSSKLGAANKSELVDYRAGFTKYGDISIERGKDINNIVYGNGDENAVASNIGRVGYFVEYVRTDNHAHKWVWVDMDAFGDRDIAAVGLPSANHQQVVNRLHVYSNHGAIDNVAADDDTVSGFIEFTPFNIHQNASSVAGAPADTTNQMDWNDTVASSGNFAAMQVFRIAPPSGRPAQTIFAFNNWRDFTESAYTPAAEFGIGNFAQHFWSGSIQTLDYIYTYRSEKMNADAYTVKNIEIWTKPVYEATVAADANFSDVATSAGLPVDASACDLVVNVTGDATLTFDSAKSVGSITFNIAENKTLTLDDVANLTVGKVILSGPGKLLIDQNITLPALNADNEAVIEVDEGKKLTVTGALVVLRGATLTIEPAVPSVSGNYTLISAGSIYNSEAITIDVSTTDSLDMETSIVEGDVILAAIPVKMFTYTAIHSDPAQAPSGWFNSWQWDGFNTYMRIGPNADANMVYEVSANEHPGSSLEKTSSFTVSLYADVSQMASDGTTRAVMFSYGGGRDNGNKFLVMYREGNYVKLANWNNGDFTGYWAASVPVATGYHLWTASFNASTGTITLYRDDGTGSGCKSSGTPAASLALASSGNNGLQIGTVWGNCPSTGNFAVGTRMALAGVYGYDVALSDTDVQNIAASYPATDTTVIPAVIDMRSSRTLTVYSSTFDAPLNGNNYFGVTHGVITIPDDTTVNVTYLKCLNTSWGQNNATLNVAGTLNVTTTSSSETTPYYDGGKGILFGHWGGTGTYNITGSLIGRNACLETVFSAGSQTININGGLLAVRDIFQPTTKSNSTINLSNNGTFELAKFRTDGNPITENFGYGTFKVADLAADTLTAPWAINFTGTSSQPTTLDPNGHTLVMSAASLTGTGYIKVASSVAQGEKGTVTFAGSAADFTGTVVIDDTSKNLITFTDITDYYGDILYTGTGTLPSYLSGFTGTLTITGSSVDATGVDLSGATVMIANGCSLTATAGLEGRLVPGSGVSVVLKVDNDLVNYDGYFPVIEGSCTVSYYNTDTSSYIANTEDDTYIIGNNLMPYYNVWGSSEDGNNNTIYADAATRWKLGSLPAANKNVAFKLDGDATVTIDATITYKDIQVYGSGTLTIRQSDANVMTVTQGFCTTAGANVVVESGLSIGAKAKIEAAGALTLKTSQTLNVASSTGALTVGGSALLSLNANLAASSLSLSDTAIVNIGPAVTLSASTLGVAGGAIVNVSSGTTTFRPTSVSGAGTVVWIDQVPYGTAWKECDEWIGTNIVTCVSVTTGNGLADMNPGNWGHDGSFIKFMHARGYFANNSKATAEIVFEDYNGFALENTNGGGDNANTFDKISGTGTIKDVYARAAQTVYILDATGFSGSIDRTDSDLDGGDYAAQYNHGRRYVFNSTATGKPTDSGGYIYVAADGSAVIGDGKSWASATTGGGIKILGTVELLGAATMSGKVAIVADSTLKLCGNTAKYLTIETGTTFTWPESGTVTVDASACAPSTIKIPVFAADAANSNFSKNTVEVTPPTGSTVGRWTTYVEQVDGKYVHGISKVGTIFSVY